ncbi:MAG: hypothetical protein LDL19_00255 [Thiobacillus sp.]|nr:hypothetical protein [Thiobacillus sp.]
MRSFTDTMPVPFDSSAALEQGFADGLAALLAAHRGLGVYILVLANAAYDPALWARLAPVLAERHAELAAAVAATLLRGGTLAEPDDDVMVFLKLNLIGFERLGRMESRRAGPWQVLFNPLRALRPPRASSVRFEGLLRPFDPAGFHFNKPFLAREVLWSGTLGGASARLLYNKFPFARLHGLLVPEPERCLPQRLTPELHAWAWELCARSKLPGLRLGYNSLGAGASVNHLHFQSFVPAGPLPIDNPLFTHNGGSRPYPLPCHRHTRRDAAWQQIERLHQHNQPYNLVYSPAGLILVPRIPQDSDRLASTCRTYGWSEMAGVVTRFSRDPYASLDTAGYEAELASFAP